MLIVSFCLFLGQYYCYIGSESPTRSFIESEYRKIGQRQLAKQKLLKSLDVPVIDKDTRKCFTKHLVIYHVLPLVEEVPNLHDNQVLLTVENFSISLPSFLELQCVRTKKKDQY
jgi:hypothetical protein